MNPITHMVLYVTHVSEFILYNYHIRIYYVLNSLSLMEY